MGISKSLQGQQNAPGQWVSHIELDNFDILFENIVCIFWFPVAFRTQISVESKSLN
jgi:hypothetical protein